MSEQLNEQELARLREEAKKMQEEAKKLSDDFGNITDSVLNATSAIAGLTSEGEKISALSGAALKKAKTLWKRLRKYDKMAIQS